MFNHEPVGYKCPFCNVTAGRHDPHTQKEDIVYKNDFVTAFIAPKWWSNNAGHVLVVPNNHYENIYDIPDEVIGDLYKVVKKISVAIRSTYDCDGTSNRQHNEPAGNQYVWHFHTHVFPRYDNDELYQNHDSKRFTDVSERLPYAEKLRKFLAAG